jgi:ATP-dependent DNA ligase
MQDTLTPMLFKTGEQIFDDPNFLYEIKWDGFRCLAKKDGRNVSLLSRNGWKMEANFPEVTDALRAVDHDFIVDGELVVFQDGREAFQTLQWRGRLRKEGKIREAAFQYPATLIVFDILQKNGQNLTGLPLTERKCHLTETISSSTRILVNQWIEGKGTVLFEETKRMGHEGIVAKRKDSLYFSGKRVNVWLKIKHWCEETVDVVGYKLRPEFSLLVTKQGKGISAVRQGMKPEEREAFLNVAKELVLEQDKDVVSIQPLLKCVVQFKEWTNEGRLRHPLFVRFVT